MPSKKINIFEGDFDSRMPLVAEEVFRNGIPFNVKFVGAMDIPRPTSRVEIVAAMRRVRFDFKAQGIKKRKVTVTISTDGIRTCTMHTKKPKKDAQNGLSHPLLDIVMEAHPIYRIFYVAHDSQDVKIFSYIARETSTSVFRCVVLKASSKNQAMKVVRTLGQAFEVSHSLNGPLDGHDQEHESSSQVRGHEPTDDRNKKMSDVTIPVFESPEREKPSLITAVDQLTGFEIAESLQPDTQQPTTPILKDFTRSLEVQLLRDKLEQSTQAVSAAVAQITLLNDQLKAESAARIEAQARTHQLLLHNNELLGHLRTLIKNINELEGNVDVEQTSTTDPSHLPQFSSNAKVERWFEYPQKSETPLHESSGYHGSTSFLSSLMDKMNVVKTYRRTFRNPSNVSL